MNNDSVTASIGGKLNSSGNEPAGEWELVYSQSNHTVSLNVSPTKRIESELTCELSKADIVQMVSWLQNVQQALPN